MLDMQNLAHQGLAVQRRHCSLGTLICFHVYKRKTARLPRVSIQHHPGVADHSMNAKKLHKLSVTHLGRQVSHPQPFGHLFRSIKQQLILFPIRLLGLLLQPCAKARGK